MSEHTKEPWTSDQGFNAMIHAGENLVATCFDGISGDGINQDMANANARRIVACVNACAGISTEELEKGSVATLARLGVVLSDSINDPEGRLSLLIRQCDEALAALEHAKERAELGHHGDLIACDIKIAIDKIKASI